MLLFIIVVIAVLDRLCLIVVSQCVYMVCCVMAVINSCVESLFCIAFGQIVSPGSLPLEFYLCSGIAPSLVVVTDFSYVSGFM